MKAAADSAFAGGCYLDCEFTADLCAELIPNGESLSAFASSTQGIPTQVYCKGTAGGVWIDVDLLYAVLPSIIEPGTGFSTVFLDVEGESAEGVALASMEADGCSKSEIAVGDTRFGCSAADGVNVFAMSDSEYTAQVAVVGPRLTVVVRVSEGDVASALGIVSHVRSLMGFAPAVDDAVAAAIG